MLVYGVVTAFRLCDISFLPDMEHISAGGVSGPIRTIQGCERMMYDIPKRYLGGLQRVMETLPYSRVPKIKPMRQIIIESPCALVCAPALGGYGAIERRR